MSCIEIESIDDKNANITFKCLNKKENVNHKTQTIPIKQYLNSIENNLYKYTKCSFCNKNENNKYCGECNKNICSECEAIHFIKNPGHILSKNNERMIKCLIHPGHDNVEFCYDCKTHLCYECLKTKKHLNHHKNNLYELKISEENILMLNKINDLLKKEKDNLSLKKK